MTLMESMPEDTVQADWRDYVDDYPLMIVLEAGLDAFVGFGYHGSTVRTIAARASLSVPWSIPYCQAMCCLIR